MKCLFCGITIPQKSIIFDYMIEEAHKIKNMVRKKYNRNSRFSALIHRILSHLLLLNEGITVHTAKESFKRGVSVFEMNAVNSAIDYWKETIKLDPKCINAYFNLGLAYLLKEDINKANDCFREVLKLDPYDSEAKTLYKHSFWYITP
jgi:tetratricopeptide (TPR) repeat protein